MSRIERLINLTAALLATERPLTSEELYERVPGYPDDKTSFRRQFERDKDALRELGMPLILVTLPNRGQEISAYRIDRDQYYVKDPGLTPDELSALSFAARLVRLDSNVTPDGALWKLRTERLEAALGTADHAAPSGATGPTADVEVPTNAALGTIFEAIAGGRSIAFVYRDESRTVVPRSLSFEKGRWYLSAFDLARDDDRSFRVDRMGTEVVLGEPATPPQRDTSRQSPSLQRPWEIGTGEPTIAHVRVDADQAPWAIRSVDANAVSTDSDDGSVIIELLVRNREAFRSFVLGFLRSAEVLDPPELRADMIGWLRSLTTSAAGQN